MSTRFGRATLALVLLAGSLAACGNEIDTRTTPPPASTQVAVRRSAAADEPCGTAEHPCLLPGLRVVGAARD